MTKLYIDTNILVYSIEDSRNLYGDDISSSSSKLFWEAASCKYHVIISDWTLNELRGLKKLEDIQMVCTIAKKKIITCPFTQEEIKQAKEQNPEHFQDELHGILALKSNADYIVTRNVGDFKQFTDRIKIVKPEHLLKSSSSS